MSDNKLINAVIQLPSREEKVGKLNRERNLKGASASFSSSLQHAKARLVSPLKRAAMNVAAGLTAQPYNDCAVTLRESRLKTAKSKHRFKRCIRLSLAEQIADLLKQRINYYKRMRGSSPTVKEGSVCRPSPP